MSRHRRPPPANNNVDDDNNNNNVDDDNIIVAPPKVPYGLENANGKSMGYCYRNVTLQVLSLISEWIQKGRILLVLNNNNDPNSRLQQQQQQPRHIQATTAMTECLLRVLQAMNNPNELLNEQLDLDLLKALQEQFKNPELFCPVNGCHHQLLQEGDGNHHDMYLFFCDLLQLLHSNTTQYSAHSFLLPNLKLTCVCQNPACQKQLSLSEHYVEEDESPILKIGIGHGVLVSQCIKYHLEGYIYDIDDETSSLSPEGRWKPNPAPFMTCGECKFVNNNITQTKSITSFPQYLVVWLDRCSPWVREFGNNQYCSMAMVTPDPYLVFDKKKGNIKLMVGSSSMPKDDVPAMIQSGDLVVYKLCIVAKRSGMMSRSGHYNCYTVAPSPQQQQQQEEGVGSSRYETTSTYNVDDELVQRFGTLGDFQTQFSTTRRDNMSELCLCMYKKVDRPAGFCCMYAQEISGERELKKAQTGILKCPIIDFCPCLNKFYVHQLQVLI